MKGQPKSLVSTITALVHEEVLLELFHDGEQLAAGLVRHGVAIRTGRSANKSSCDKVLAMHQQQLKEQMYHMTP
jgi:hypothetical protein